MSGRRRGATSGSARTNGSVAGVLWLQGLLCGAGFAVEPAAATLLVVLLLPGLAMVVLDRSPGRPAGRAVLLFGLAGALPALHAFWSGSGSLSATTALLTDPARVTLAWLMAATGWVIAELAPVAIRIVRDTQTRAEIAELTRAREEIAAEWGLAGGDGAVSSVAVVPTEA